MEVRFKVNNNKNKITAVLIFSPFLILFVFLLILVRHNKNALIFGILCICLWVFILVCILASGINIYEDRIIAKAFIFKKVIKLDDIGSVDLISSQQNAAAGKKHRSGILIFCLREGTIIQFFHLKSIGDDIDGFIHMITEIKPSIEIGKKLQDYLGCFTNEGF